MNWNAVLADGVHALILIACTYICVWVQRQKKANGHVHHRLSELERKADE